MTDPTPTKTPPPDARRAVLLVVAAAVAVLVIGAGAVWALFLRSDAPPAVGLSSPSPAASVPASSSPVASATASGSVLASPSPDASLAASAIDGTWTVDPSVGSFSDFSGSFVGYRIDEQLAGVGAKAAVGRTPDVTGSMTIDGTTVTEVDIEADLTALQSDDDRRDGQLRRQGLETGTFPTATFVLTAPIELGAVPAEGEVIAATATGDLTLHGQTRSVAIPLEARLEGEVITITGSLPILLADFGIEKPRSFLVLSIADEGTLELQLHFKRG